MKFCLAGPAAVKELLSLKFRVNVDAYRCGSWWW
jgi:hypothetical protein